MAADVYQLIIGGTLCGQPVENVLHYQDTATADPNPQTKAAHLEAGWSAAMLAAWLNVCPSNYDLIGYKCKRVNNGGGPNVTLIEAPGSVGSEPSAANDSCVGPVIIASYTDTVRWFAGRIFLPGIGDGEIDNNVFGPAVLANLAVINGLWSTPIANGGDTFNFVIWSPTKNDAFVPVAFTVSNRVGTQRRRLVPTF